MRSFHIDLSHVQDTTGIQVKFGSHVLDLQRHTLQSLAAATETNYALAALPANAHSRFTHFVDIAPALLPTNSIQWLRVVRPQKNPTIFVPDLFLMGLYIPESYREVYYQKKLKKTPNYRHPVLASYGLTTSELGSDTLKVCLDASYLVTPMGTASGLIALHPNLASTQPYTANVVINNHILPDPTQDPDQYNRMQILSNTITAATPANPWAPVVPCKDSNGNTMTSGVTIPGVVEAGQSLYTQTLNDQTSQACAAPTAYAQRSASNDLQLQNQTWTVQHGTAASQTQQNQGATTLSQSRSLSDSSTYNWSVNQLTPHHGLSVDSSSIKIDDGGNFSIDASNSYLRSLYACYQLLDDSGNPTSDPQEIQYITAVNTIMGIPMPTEPSTLSIDLQGANGINLLFGGFGTSDWESASNVSLWGGLVTGACQYGVPLLFMVAGTALDNSKAFNEICQDSDLMKLLAKTCFQAIGEGALTAAIDDLKAMMSLFGDAIVGILLADGLEKLQAFIMEKVAASQLKDAAGPLGLAFKVASAALDGEEIAVSTGEILSSPATIRVKVSRTIDVTLSLLPDPAHGEAGNPQSAVWPALAQTYKVILEYKDGGTPIVITGDMLPTTNNTPIPLNFSPVLAGANSQFRITASICSSTGWVCGRWQSDWTPAVPNSGSTLALGNETITEILVPLTMDTQYQIKEKVVYQNNDYVWQATHTPPATTIASLNCGTNGTLCQLSDLTINNSAFQIGYAWRASGLNLPLDGINNPASPAQEYALQNLSVLADPGSRLKTSQIGFTNQALIAYAGSAAATPNEINQNNFILDPRNNQLHLRQVTLDNQDGGPNNFGFANANLQSWGTFPIQNLDAIAVHPSNAVVGISYQYHKLLILNLPSAPVDDDDAPMALQVSGYGVRQGLMQGPKAMAIAPDGRILILEADSQRVQAFDVKGNPVPCFEQSTLASVTGDPNFANSLDSNAIPASLQTALQNAYAPGVFLFVLDSSLIAALNAGQFQTTNDPIITALSTNGVFLSYDPDNMNDHTVSSYITVNQAGQAWTITDPGQNLIYQIANQSGDLYVFQVISQYQIVQIEPGQEWTLLDTYQAQAYHIEASVTQTGRFDIAPMESYFPLYNPNKETDIQYLDMAVESQGYIYVLSYVGNGSQASDYRLDIYEPNGTFMVRVPDASKTSTPQNVVAGRIAIDVFRNLFTLNYETFTKPSGGLEPSISQWVPTPPLFTIPNAQTAKADFNSANIGNVINDFKQYGNITLNYQTTSISTVSTAGLWSVKDSSNSNANYQVAWAGADLQVYTIPVA